jgi:hypothetical protein
MKRIQNALFVQLKDKGQKVDLEVREKEEEVKKASTQREQIGVDLYQAQQNLARLQGLLESSHDNFNVIRGIREETERHLKVATNQHKDEISKLKESQQKCTLPLPLLS